jgi:hypothetical protein
MVRIYSLNIQVTPNNLQKICHAEKPMKESWNAEPSIGKEKRGDDVYSFSFFLLFS